MKNLLDRVVGAAIVITFGVCQPSFAEECKTTIECAHVLVKEANVLKAKNAQLESRILDAESKIKALTDATKNLEPFQLYQCPSTTDHYAPGFWATFGCVGQLGKEKSCASYTFVGPGNGQFKTFSCDPVQFYKVKQ